MPASFLMKSSGHWCKTCYDKAAEIHGHWKLRPFQAIVTIIVFATAFTGSIPSLLTAWAFHITLCLLTLGSVLNSCVMRGSEPPETGYLHYGLKRDMLGTLLWAGMTAAWMWEVIQLDWQTAGAANLVVLLMFCWVELFTFAVSCYKDYLFMKTFNAYRRRLKEAP